jgi:hypothetical protein
MHFSYPKGMYLTFTGRHWSKTDGLLDLPPPPPNIGVASPQSYKSSTFTRPH